MEWSHEGVDGSAEDEGLDVGDRGEYVSMTISADGTIWMSYYDANNRNLRYATRGAQDTEWTTNSADGGGGL